MSLNYVTLTGTIPGAYGATVTFTPSNWLTDATDRFIEAPIPVTVTPNRAGLFSVSLLATDNANLPPGWFWTVLISGIAGTDSESFSFNLLFANGATQDLSQLATLPNPVPITPFMPVPTGTPIAGEVPIATGSGEASAWGLATGLRPSGDTTGVTDLANIAALCATGVAVLGPGTFYVNGPVVPPSGSLLRGAKGATSAGTDGFAPQNPGQSPGATVIVPTASWATTFNTSGVITLPAGSVGTHIRDLWVVGLSTPSGSTGPANLDGICTNGSGASAVYLQNVGSVWNTGNGIAAYAGGGWHMTTCYEGNNLGHGVVCQTADSVYMNVHAQSNGQGGTIGDGFFNISADTKLIGCRADLNQNGFTVNGADGSGFMSSVTLTGCSTQRNNFEGLNVINSNPVGNALRDPVIVSGCSFMGDGINGTNTPNGIIGGVGGGGYAGIAVAGRNTVQATGTNVLVATVDVAGGCPQYGVATATSGSGNTKPTLVQINGGVLNAVTAPVNDAAGMGAAIRISPLTQQNTGQQYDAGTSYPYQGAEFLGAQQDLFTQPSGCIAATMPRGRAVQAVGAMTSGTVYVRSIGVLAGQLVSNIGFLTNSTAEAGGSHGWYVLLDKNMKVQAVTADQTGATFFAASTMTPLAVGTPYRATYSGLYYVGVCVVATTMPTFSGDSALASGAAGAVPVYCGSSSTGQSTPPSVGTTLAAAGSNGTFDLYSWLT